MNQSPPCVALNFTNRCIQLLTTNRPWEASIFFAFHVNFRTFSSPDGWAGLEAWNSALSAFTFFFQNWSLKVFFFSIKVNFFLPLSLNLLFFGNTTYYLDTGCSRYLRNGPAFLRFLRVSIVFARSFHHARRGRSQVGSSHHQPLSSAQRCTAALAQQRSASSAAQRRAVAFPGVPWCALVCPAVRCGTAVRCCAVLCGAVPCCAVVSSCHTREHPESIVVTDSRLLL